MGIEIGLLPGYRRLPKLAVFGRREVDACLGAKGLPAVSGVVGANRGHIELTVPLVVGRGIVEGGTIDQTITAGLLC